MNDAPPTLPMSSSTGNVVSSPHEDNADLNRIAAAVLDIGNDDRMAGDYQSPVARPPSGLSLSHQCHINLGYAISISWVSLVWCMLYCMSNHAISPPSLPPYVTPNTPTLSIEDESAEQSATPTSSVSSGNVMTVKPALAGATPASVIARPLNSVPSKVTPISNPYL